MKAIYAAIISIALATISGCNGQSNDNAAGMQRMIDDLQSSDVAIAAFDENTTDEAESSLYDIIKGSDIELSGYNNDFASKDITIVEKGTGRLFGNENTSTLYSLVSVGKAGSFRADYILHLQTDSGMLLHYLGVYASSYHRVFCVDIDRDGLEEIIVGLSSSGASIDSCSNIILKYDGTELNTVFKADGTNREKNQINWIETGFGYAFGDHYGITVRNIANGYQERFDARELLDEWLLSILYDSDGSVNIGHPLHELRFKKDQFCENAYPLYEFDVFLPVDMDGDGAYEILAAESITFDFESSILLGTGFTVLSYNTHSGQFDVMDAAFAANELKDTNDSEYTVFGLTLSEIAVT